MRHLTALETTPPTDPLLDPRELQIEVRQLRQEALKVLATVRQAIEQLS